MIPAQPRLFWLTLAVIVMALVTGSFAPKHVDLLPGEFELPVLALELVRTPGDAARVLDGDARRSGLRRSTYADFGFIIVYTLLWVAMGRRVSRIVAILALLGGLADVIEDIGMLTTIEASTPSQAIVHWTYFVSSVKWLLLGLVFIALFFYFRPRHGLRDGWDLAKLGAGLAYAYSGIICVAGVFIYNPLIERSLLPLSVALILQLIVSLLAL